jgi:tRNA-Thr(GGU) m(6)t(6)A37 methyltransferase TsaA
VKSIGTIHSRFHAPAGTLLQPAFGEDEPGTVELLPEYAEGLHDLDGFERIWLLYRMHLAPPPQMRVVPFRDTQAHGVFATRAPCRPNPIGLSCVRLLRIEGCTLFIGGVDILDGTPLLDIKTYVPEYDAFPQSRAGWLERGALRRTHDDGRFSTP